MNDQLQDLLKRVYEEGVAKAKDEAEKIISEAKTNADSIIAKAQTDAEATVAEAKKQAAELSKNTNNDLKMASNHTLSALKQKITDLVLNAALDTSTKNSFQDKDFTQALIKEALSGWKESNGCITLAQSLQAKLDDAFIASLRQMFDAKLQIEYSPLLKEGFTISPLDGSYKISFTDEDFASLFKNYLRPRTAKILFES